ncbi:MAG: hypothetical protein M1370_10120 [Bacteroidetes bacterium]|nr:hypothetical protein [Bacteroidota bacterium]MCL5024983.1 hypothetical protein [Chloroflexota bacterium]
MKSDEKTRLALQWLVPHRLAVLVIGCLMIAIALSGSLDNHAGVYAANLDQPTTIDVDSAPLTDGNPCAGLMVQDLKDPSKKLKPIVSPELALSTVTGTTSFARYRN